MNQPDWDNDPILKKFMIMCKHQSEYMELYKSNHLANKQEKARKEKIRYFEKVRREKALLQLL